MFKILSMCAKFQVNKYQFSIQKKPDGGNFTPTSLQGLQVQNTSVGIGLIELTKSSDTLNYKLFFKHCILQTILPVFILKTDLYFIFF